MAIELTYSEQSLNLEKVLQATDESLRTPKDFVATSLLSSIRSLARIALWLRAALTDALDGKRQACEDADNFAQRLGKVIADNNILLRERVSLLDDRKHFIAERDKLLAELEEKEIDVSTPFGAALQDVELYHQQEHQKMPTADAENNSDPFGHQTLADKHGMGLDSFPLVEVERILASPEMGSLASWRRIAHQALLAMSYLMPLSCEEGETVIIDDGCGDGRDPDQDDDSCKDEVYCIHPADKGETTLDIA